MGREPLLTVVVMEGMRLTLHAPVLTTVLVDCCFVAAAMSAAAPPPGYLPEK